MAQSYTQVCLYFTSLPRRFAVTASVRPHADKQLAVDKANAGEQLEKSNSLLGVASFRSIIISCDGGTLKHNNMINHVSSFQLMLSAKLHNVFTTLKPFLGKF